MATGSGAAHSPISSSPVYTATTPAAALAADVSMERMRARATGLRTSANHSAPGI